MISVRVRSSLAGFELDVAWDAPEGKILVLFGPSGAGKSLTLAALAGLWRPDAGRIAVGARARPRVWFDASEGIWVEPHARRVGMVRQDVALFPHLSAADNIGYGLTRMSAAQRRARVTQFLEMMQLDGLGTRKPAELSGGQQQRVALARALAVEPALLLLDEPFAGLDAPVRMELRRELKALQARLGTSMALVTHDLGEAAGLADEMAVMAEGRILQTGTPGDMLRSPVNSTVARIVGVRNVLPAQALTENCLQIGEYRMQTNPLAFPPPARVMACIRPERVMLVRRDAASRERPNTLEGDLVGEESDGNTVILRFRSCGARLQPGGEFDLEIDLPVYVYERLNLAQERHWLVSLHPNVVQVVEE